MAQNAGKYIYPQSDKDVDISNLEKVSANAAKENYAYTDEEKKLLRKMDLRILPILFLIYFGISADGSFVGQAMQMNRDKRHDLTSSLNATLPNISLGVAAYYLGLAVAELPWNLQLARWSPNLLLGRVAITWGIITCFFVAVKSAPAFVFMRFLLGIFGSGGWSGNAFYVSILYRKAEVGVRIGFFFLASLVAGMASGFIAYGFSFMDGLAGLEGWRWMYLFLGIISIITGFFALALLPHRAENPKSLSFFTSEERELVLSRKYRETATRSHFGLGDVIKVLANPKIYFLVVLNSTINVITISLQNYTPVILASGAFGLKPVTISLWVTIPYVLALIGTLVTAKLSDNVKDRSIYLIILQILTGTGFFILQFGTTPAVKFFGLCFTFFFGGAIAPITLVWTINSYDTDVAMAAASALAPAVSFLVSFFALTYMYIGWPADIARHYLGSNMLTLSIAWLGALCTLSYRLYLMRENSLIDRNGVATGGRTIKYLL